MHIRPVTPEDLPDIVRMNTLCGFPPRSESGWDWVLFHNPEQGVHAPGLIAEKDGKTVAFIGAAGRKLIGPDGPLLAIIGHTFVSDLSSPGVASRLIKYFFTHCPAAVYSLNNNALSAPIYKRRGAVAFWGGRGQQYLEKRLNLPRIAMSGALRRLARKERVHHILARREWFQGRSKKAPVPVREGMRRIHPLIAEDAAQLDAFDERLKTSGRIHGARGSALWSYRLQDPDRTDQALLHGILDDEGLAAFLVTSVSKDVAFGVTTLEIEDAVLAPGVPAHLLGALLHQAETHARHVKAARIVWRVLPDEDVSTITEPLGYTLKERGYDSCHMRLKGDWNPASWEISGIDGDFWFAMRRPPRD